MSPTEVFQVTSQAVSKAKEQILTHEQFKAEGPLIPPKEAFRSCRVRDFQDLPLINGETVGTSFFYPTDPVEMSPAMASVVQKCMDMLPEINKMMGESANPEGIKKVFEDELESRQVGIKFLKEQIHDYPSRKNYLTSLENYLKGQNGNVNLLKERDISKLLTSRCDLELAKEEYHSSAIGRDPEVENKITKKVVDAAVKHRNKVEHFEKKYGIEYEDCLPSKQNKCLIEAWEEELKSLILYYIIASEGYLEVQQCYLNWLKEHEPCNHGCKTSH